MTTNNSQNNLETLDRLCELVEKSGVDIAPDYNEYMVLAFAIANSCGEAGRSCFHRLCVLSYKYNATGADRLYTEAVKKGRGGNSLGTAFHLAEVAGVDLGEMRRFLPQEDASVSRFPAVPPRYVSTQAPACACVNKVEDETLPYEMEYVNIPGPFPEYRWSSFLQRIVDCGVSKAQSDMLFCATMAALGETVCRFTYVYYANAKQYPCLQVYVVAPAASGKGAISWVRQLVVPYHKEKMARNEVARKAYQAELLKWTSLGKNKEEEQKPQLPKMELFFIAGDNSGTGIQENVIDNDGFGLIIEAEAEVLAASIAAEYGQWSHLLRKAFDHEFLSYNRRKDHEYRECDTIRLAVAICGTPGQLVQLIPGAENGLFSRELFYFMPQMDVYLNMFETKSTEDYRDLFRRWGERWKLVVDAMRQSVSVLQFIPTKKQEKRVYERMAQLFYHADVAHGGSMRSTVARLETNVLRIMNVVALMRSLDSLLMMEDEALLKAKLANIARTLMECEGIEVAQDVHPENIKDGTISKFVLRISEEDFAAVLSTAEVLYRHAEYALRLMPEDRVEERKVTPKEQFLSSLPMLFTRQEYVEKGTSFGLSSKQCDRLVEKLLKKGTVERVDQGKYCFVVDKRKETSQAQSLSGTL